MFRFKFICEDLISPSTEPNTMTFWHGGNLDSSYEDSIAQKSGRWEFGPGLYLTTHYGTAVKYSKGSRKLYQIVVKKGTDISEVKLESAIVKDWVKNNCLGSKKKEVIYAIDMRGEKIDADIFLNIIVNHKAIQSSKTRALRQFLIQNGIDYCLVPNAFGWGEMMMVLFNMRKIVKQTQIKPKDKLSTYELESEWVK